MMIGFPTLRFGTEASVIVADPWARFPVTLTGPLVGPFFQLLSPEAIEMLAADPLQLAAEVGARIVWSAPAPRSVTLDTFMQIPAVTLL
jgi:hypothetical protein